MSGHDARTIEAVALALEKQVQDWKDAARRQGKPRGSLVGGAEWAAGFVRSLAPSAALPIAATPADDVDEYGRPKLPAGKVYEAAVKGRQDFRKAYRQLLPVARAAAALCLLWRTPGETTIGDNFMDALNTLDVAVSGGGRSGIALPKLEAIAALAPAPATPADDVEGDWSADDEAFVLRMDNLLDPERVEHTISCFDLAYLLNLARQARPTPQPAPAPDATDALRVALSKAADEFDLILFRLESGEPERAMGAARCGKQDAEAALAPGARND